MEDNVKRDANKGGEPSAADIVYGIFENAIEMGAEDIYIEPYEEVFRVRFRINGRLKTVMYIPLPMKEATLARFKELIEGLDISENRVPQQGIIRMRMKEREFDILAQIIPGMFGERIALSLKQRGDERFEYDIEKLGMEEDQLTHYRNAIERKGGLIVIAGPSHSGMNSVIYASLLELAGQEDSSIATVEAFPRASLPYIHQMIVNEDAGLNYAAGVRVLSKSVDTLYVREMPDLETADACIKAVLHNNVKLFTTFHTSNASDVIARLLNYGVEPWLAAQCLGLIQGQRLLRRLCDRCKVPQEGVPEDILMAAGMGKNDCKSATIFKAVGCDECNNTGYRGEVLVCETMPITDELRGIIVGNSSDPNQAAKLVNKAVLEAGMRSLRQSALRKAWSGLVSLDEAIMKTRKDELQ